MDNIQPSPAAALALRIQSGDRNAEQELVQHFAARIEFILRRHCHDPSLVADLRQETFIIALQKLRGGGLEHPDKLAAFLHQIAHNLATYEARRFRRRNTHPDWDAIERQASRDLPLLERLEKEQLSSLIKHLLLELKTPRDQQLLSRYYLTEESKQTICADLAVSSEHFDRILHRARKRFRELLIQQLGQNFWP